MWAAVPEEDKEKGLVGLWDRSGRERKWGEGFRERKRGEIRIPEGLETEKAIWSSNRDPWLQNMIWCDD